MTAEKKIKNDRALRFYNEVLGLDHLHYGLWGDDDELTIENLKKAQKSYEDFLVENIPENTKTILDVGCGTGELSKRLKSIGYDVEGVSPDVHQKEIYPEKVNAPFHHFCFEEFKPEKKYDMVVMSESCQYVPLDKLFTTAAKTIQENGYLMICDYFVLNNVSGILAKSGHNMQQFIETAANNGFEAVKEEDITDRVTKTLDISTQIINKVILALEIGSEKFREKHPVVTKFLNWMVRKKISKFKDQMELMDADKFSAAKRYKFFLFKNSLSN